MNWPSHPQAYAGEFERAYLAYARIISERGEVPASREVILEEARCGFDGVVRLLEQRIYSPPRKEVGA